LTPLAASVIARSILQFSIYNFQFEIPLPGAALRGQQGCCTFFARAKSTHETLLVGWGIQSSGLFDRRLT
jgi:hypothetical protein